MRALAHALPLSALALAAAPVQAAEPLTASVSGYFNVGVGYADKAGDDEDEAFGVFRDGEIHFDFEGSSDNGLTFGGEVELEAFTSDGDQIDENSAYVSGAFGELAIGGQDTALNEVGGVGVVKPNGSYLNYYDSDGDVLPGHPGGFIGEDDAIGIHYTTPTVAGFTAGVTWQPDPDADGVSGDSNALVTSPDGAEDNQFAVGANYTGDFQGVSLSAGGGYLGNEALDAWHVGAELGYAGFAVAGFYNDADEDPVIGDNDEQTWGLGARYATGPWSLGGGYAYQETDNAGPAGETVERNFIHAGGGYDLAPGVTTYAAVQWGEDDPGDDGMGVWAWLNLRF